MDATETEFTQAARTVMTKRRTVMERLARQPDLATGDDPWTNNPRHVGKWHCRTCNRVFAHPSHQYTACAVQAHLVSPAHLKAAHA